jgi:predicted dehydrogenase
MGEMYLNQMIKSHQWEIRAVCDNDPDALAIAANLSPEGTLLTDDENRVFEDPEIEVVVLATLADSRKQHIYKGWNNPST